MPRGTQLQPPAVDTDLDLAQHTELHGHTDHPRGRILNPKSRALTSEFKLFSRFGQGRPSSVLPGPPDGGTTEGHPAGRQWPSVASGQVGTVTGLRDYRAGLAAQSMPPRRWARKAGSAYASEAWPSAV
ncbi:hypothetical protein GCM10010321_18990 [Streptomyces chartreusis]|nr:hypothetical protein GCM10010321_18990 [Streptomyces chartreusis]